MGNSSSHGHRYHTVSTDPGFGADIGTSLTNGMNRTNSGGGSHRERKAWEERQRERVAAVSAEIAGLSALSRTFLGNQNDPPVHSQHSSHTHHRILKPSLSNDTNSVTVPQNRVDISNPDIYGSVLPNKPSAVVYRMNKFGFMELKNEHHMPWPRFIFDRNQKKIIGIQRSDGTLDRISGHSQRVCEFWGLEYVREDYDQETVYVLDNVPASAAVIDPPPYSEIQPEHPPSYNESLKE